MEKNIWVDFFEKLLSGPVTEFFPSKKWKRKSWEKNKVDRELIHKPLYVHAYSIYVCCHDVILKILLYLVKKNRWGC